MPIRTHRVRTAAVLASIAAAAAIVPAARADEGMWLLNNPPRELLRSKYDFSPSDEWLEHVQKSAVRFSTGGSGSIVSRDGLVMTNHHVASDILAKLSTPERDLLENGFHARTRAEELPCPDLELNVLWSIEDVTDRVNAAAEGKQGAEANTARRQMMATIEKESQEATGLLSQIVTLYQGGRYHLYRYKRFTDVRLVFAPEQAIAFFGGDTDNFEYPRYCLDVAFFRIYEGGEPLQAEHHLAWSEAGSRDGDLAIVIGHPGTTRRLYTLDHLRFLRDVENPFVLRNLWRQEVKLQNFSARSKENARIAEDDLFGVANGRKFLTGQLETLQDPRIMARKAQEEAALRAAVAENPQWAEQWGGAWDEIARAQEARREFFVRAGAVGGTFGSDLYSKARTIVRLAAELPRPSAERLREYRDSNLESVYLGLYSPAPIYADLERAKLAWGLANMAELLGGEDPLVVAALAGKSPADRAAELVAGSVLFDPEARRALVEGGADALAATDDPLIKLAMILDPEARALRTRAENEVDAVTTEAYAKIAAARFAVLGDGVYPDATFTLRMSFGPIKGYEEDGEFIPPYTDFAGLYARHRERAGEKEFDLPQVWLEKKAELNLTTPFNFVLAADIIGGNSGSPVINKAGEVIGLIFDGNIHFLGAAIAYDDRQGRAVAVDSRAIIEALDKVYNADELVKEITAK